MAKNNPPRRYRSSKEHPVHECVDFKDSALVPIDNTRPTCGLCAKRISCAGVDSWRTRDLTALAGLARLRDTLPDPFPEK